MFPSPRNSLACVLLMAGLTLPAPRDASAYRDCWSVRSFPPRLIGVSFYGPSDEVLDRLTRAGFQDYDPAHQRIEGLGILTGTHGPAHEPTEQGWISAMLLTPSIVHFELACGPPRGVIPMPMGGHPNGARMLRTVIAVVADLDQSCAVVQGNGFRPWGSPKFGPAYDDPALGARVREAHYDFGALRLIAPMDRNGPAARWLAAGGPRWIGFAVEVGDLEDTERWLRRERVDFDVVSCGTGCCVRIDPEVLDGLLVEFVPSRPREQGPKCSGGIRF